MQYTTKYLCDISREYEKIGFKVKFIHVCLERREIQVCLKKGSYYHPFVIPDVMEKLGYTVLMVDPISVNNEIMIDCCVEKPELEKWFQLYLN